MGGEWVGGVGPCVGDVAPRVGDVAPTYDIPVGRPHVADAIIFPANSLLS